MAQGSQGRACTATLLEPQDRHPERAQRVLVLPSAYFPAARIQWEEAVAFVGCEVRRSERLAAGLEEGKQPLPLWLHSSGTGLCSCPALGAHTFALEPQRHALQSPSHCL